MIFKYFDPNFIHFQSKKDKFRKEKLCAKSEFFIYQNFNINLAKTISTKLGINPKIWSSYCQWRAYTKYKFLTNFIYLMK